MNLSHLIKNAVFLVALSVLTGCSNLSVNDREPSGPSTPTPGKPINSDGSIELEEGDSLFVIRKDGTIVPVTEDGREYTRCGKAQTDGKVCRIFRGGITVTDLEELSIMRLRYSGSGVCQMFVFYNRALEKMDYVFNPNDPNCAHHHP